MLDPRELQGIKVNLPERQQKRGIDFPVAVAPTISNLSDIQRRDLELVSVTADSVNAIARVAYNFKDADKNMAHNTIALQGQATGQIVNLIEDLRTIGTAVDMREGKITSSVSKNFVDVASLIAQTQQSPLTDGEKKSRVAKLERMQEQAKVNQPLSSDQVSELHDIALEAAKWHIGALQALSIPGGVSSAKFNSNAQHVKSRMNTAEGLALLVSMLPGLRHDLSTPVASLSARVQLQSRRSTVADIEKAKSVAYLWQQCFEYMGIFSRTLLEGLKYGKYTLDHVQRYFSAAFEADRTAMFNSIFTTIPDAGRYIYLYWDDTEIKRMAYNVLQNAHKADKRKRLQPQYDDSTMSIVGSMDIVDYRGEEVKTAQQVAKYVRIRFVDTGDGFVVDERLLGENPFSAGIHGWGHDTIETHGDGMQGMELLIKQRGGKIITSNIMEKNDKPQSHYLVSRFPKSDENVLGGCIDVYLPIF